MAAPRVDQTDLRELAAIVGPRYVRPAETGDMIDGVSPRFVVEPGSIEETSAVLRLASDSGMAVIPRGGGTMLGWGNPPSRLDLALCMTRLNRLLEHAAGDLVVRAEAGLPLAVLQQEVAKAGQQLALDRAEDGATIGGVVAANHSGPRRLRYGTVRDVLIGITYVLPDGTVAKAGGKVVKNVAGYDLQKLFTGSFGTLAVIAEVILRLHPLPAAHGTVVVDVGDPEGIATATQAIMHSALVPSAIELAWDGAHGRLLVYFEGIAPGVAAQTETARELLRPFGSARILGRAEESELWRATTRPSWHGAALLRVTALPTDVPAVIRDLDELGRGFNTSPRVVGRAAAAVLLVDVPQASEESLIGLVRELRKRMNGRGSVVVLQAPLRVKQAVDVWGPAEALPLMRRVKARFDPNGIMSPGRFVGGL